MYVCMNVCHVPSMNVCMYVCMYVCMLYVCMFFVSNSSGRVHTQYLGVVHYTLMYRY